MSPVTIFLAKLIGLYCIVIALGMIVNRRSVLSAVNAMLKSPSTLFIVGVFTTAIGLAMVVGHNIWRGGAATVLVTIIGWLSLAKGLALAFTPYDRMLRFYETLGYEKRFSLFMGVTLALGAYLAAAGFRLI